MPLDAFCNGATHVVLVYCKPDGSSPVRELLGGMQEGDRKKMLALIRFSSENGPPRNREKNHQVEGHRFFEFKIPRFRIFWRWSPDNAIILMDGFEKQSNRISQRELDAGDRLYGIIDDELRGTT